MGATFPISFRNGPLRAHRRKILFEREKSLLPSLQIYAEYRRKIEELTAEKNKLYEVFGHEYVSGDTVAFRYATLRNKILAMDYNIKKEKKEILRLRNEDPEKEPSTSILLKKARETRNELREAKQKLEEEFVALQPRYLELQEEYEKVSRELRRFTNLYNDKEGTVERREFVMRCPAEECRGFLSTSYKCGTCEGWTCVDCHVPLGKDKHAEHTCNADDILSAKAIKDETKPCPKCGTRIFKIDGCFAKNTPILMWNGTTKQSQDIIVGDLLIGDDGKPRTVEGICSGEDDMYRIDQNDGMTYTVNSHHKLVLKFSGHKQIYWSQNAWKIKWLTQDFIVKVKKFSTSETTSKEEAFNQAETFKESLEQNDIFEIMVKDYITLLDSTKKHLMGFKSQEIEWPEQDVKLDPYMLGLYLGDGVNNGIDFAACAEKDPEIIQYLLNWCKEHNSELVHDNAYKFRIRRRGVERGRYAIERGATSKTCKGCSEKVCKQCDLPEKPYDTIVEKCDKRNQLKEALDYYNQIRNKHIPDEFLYNSRKNRLLLLAGIIDTDGYLGNEGKRAVIPQANHTLLNQIEVLARSLGFITHIDVLKKKNISFAGSVPKDYPDQLRLSISGTLLSDIPTLVSRKKCINSTPNKDMLRTSIKVSHVGRGAYYGWNISGNKRFLLKDTTVVRNCDQIWCVVETCHTAFSWKTGTVVTGVIHNPHYYEWLRRKEGGEIPREAGDIPCGGMPTTWQMVAAIRNIEMPNDIAMILLENFRNLQDLIEGRMRDYPSRLPQLANKENDVDYLLNEITEDVWQHRLERTESKFLKKKEIGQILQTLATAGSDMMNRIYDRAIQAFESGIEAEELFVEWVLNAALPELEQLRVFGNDSLLALARRDRMAVPQFDCGWAWKSLRAIYSSKSAHSFASTAATETQTETEIVQDVS